MDLTGPISLVLMFLMSDGDFRLEFRPMPSTDRCWEAARAFIIHPPKEFDALAIGAGCMVNPKGQGI